MPEKMLRMSDVKETVGLGRSTIYRMISRGEFPQPVRVGQRAVAWPNSTIQSWVNERCKNQAA